MKYILQILGTMVYSIIASYILWLLFYWITPYVMGAGWLLFILYLFLAGGFVTMIIGTISTWLAIPIAFLTKKNKTAKIVNSFAFIFYGYSAIALPFHLDMHFGVLKWILAIMLCVTAFISFLSMIMIPYQIDDDDER